MTTTRDAESAVSADGEVPAVGENTSGTDTPAEDAPLLVELAQALAQVRGGRFDVRLARREGPASCRSGTAATS
jgi:hypothetical protein